MLSDDFKQQLLETFLHELEDIALSFNQSILTLEKLLSEKKPDNASLDHTFKELLRLSHNIKGSSRAIGLNAISELAHQLETVFSSIEKKHTLFSKKSMDLVLQTIDTMKRIAKQSFQNKPVDDIHSLMQALADIFNTSNQATTEVKKMVSTPAFAIKTEPETTDSVRVSTKKLDHISVFSDALQLNMQQLQNYAAELMTAGVLEKTKKHFSNTSAFRSILKKIKRNVDQLQYETKLLRLVPATFLLHQMPRIARDLSQELNKQIQLEMTGEHIEVDRKVLENLHDPFIHLLRNAIDHGIESPEQRKARHKPDTGKITIRVASAGEKILFEISDDGNGIDTESILQTAIKRRLLKPEAVPTLTHQEIIDFIFRPGFSSKSMITSVSGRGVGLDVVRNHVQRLNGTVTINTTPAHGTTISILVPLTIATDRGLIIKTNQQLFAIPTISIERLLSVPQHDLVELEGNLTLTLNEHAIALRELSAILYPNLKTSTLADTVTIVLLSLAGKKLGLIVDTILGESTLVIKPLSAPLSKVPCISGGTIYQDGTTALVLNPNELMHAAGSPEKLVSQLHTSQTQQPIKKQILVVDDSITTRTLEKNILETHGYAITTASDGQEALNILKKQHFDLIVTDILMPIMDGLTLTKTLKTNDQYKHIPVIIVTTLGSDSEKQKGLEVGADAYLIKHEFQSQILIDIVRQLL